MYYIRINLIINTNWIFSVTQCVHNIHTMTEKNNDKEPKLFLDFLYKWINLREIH